MENPSEISKIRNFCIISHVDHGKSTLADRMLEFTGTVPKNKLKEQFLDQMDIERERGITIKLQPVAMNWKGYQLNLIDTPGHVDFNYEVSRSLAAVEGAILLVDATQGIQSQTLNNLTLAQELGLTIIPVINKIDLPSAQVEKTKATMVETLGFDESDILLASGKAGSGVTELLDEIVKRVPPPEQGSKETTRALIFDTTYDQFKGVIAFVRVLSGELQAGQELLMMGTGATSICIETGVFKPSLTPTNTLKSGAIGYIATGLKDVSLSRVGDTVTDAKNPAPQALPGYKEIKPMVFAAFYPIESNEFENLRNALSKLRLTDGAFSYEPESSSALGFGFRCGFLGLLHLEVVQERLEREYGIDLIATAPTVKYLILTTKDETLEIDNPSKFPLPNFIKIIKEPWVKATIITPSAYIGNLMELINQKRGAVLDMIYQGERVVIKVDIPLGEIVTDFFDRLKSVSSGYASLDYELEGYRDTEVNKVQILVNGDVVDALSIIVPSVNTLFIARELVRRLKEEIPRSNIEIAIQASVNGKIIARETLSGYRKDVIAKLYGGDVTRKNKLLDKQREGKKRMKMVGTVAIPQEAFLSVLKHSPTG